jgi:hypothetical protein
MIANAAAAYRKTTLGADLALPLGNWIIRAEAACNITKNPDNEMYIPNPDLSYVAGLETNVAGFYAYRTIYREIHPGLQAADPSATRNSPDPGPLYSIRTK